MKKEKMRKSAQKMVNFTKKQIISMFFCCLMILMGSCDHTHQGEKFDKTLLSGYWISGTLYEYYNADGSGYTWDIADDVTEEEAQPFTWTLEDATLTQIHKMEMGGNVPKVYTVTKLNTTTLEYHDDYGKYYTFTKER